MTQRIATISALAALWLAFGTPLHAQDNLSRMEEVVQSYVSTKQFMGSVLVARGETIVLDKGYGFANLEWNIPNSPATKFRLGSITKQFTAASILLLEERGKLKTDDLVKKFMPDAPAAWDKITIFHLLTHTSGIPSFTDFPDYKSQEPFAVTPEKTGGAFSRQAARFPARRKVELQQLGIRPAGLPAGEGQRQELREVLTGEYLWAARHEEFGLRLELRRDPEA